MSAIAIPWFVLISTGSPTKTGLVSLAEMLPLVLSKAFGGPLIDRIGPRRISIVADAGSMLVVALIPLLHTINALNFATLLVLVGIAGALRGPGDAAKGTLVPEIAEAARVPLERVTGLESTTERLAGFLAFGLAGGLIAVLGEVNALWIDAASFGFCAVLFVIWAPRRHRTIAKEQEEGSYTQRLREGWTFLRKDRLMMPLVLMIALTNLLDAAVVAVMIPVWMRTHGYGPGQTGMVLTAFFITATAFALVAAGIGERIPRRTAFILSFLICGAPRFVVLALDVPLWVVLVTYAVGGVGGGFINPVLGALFIERVPRPMLGRVNSLAEAVGWAGVPLGGVLAGATIAGIGLTPTFLVAGGLYLLATIAPVLFGRNENWGGRSPQPLGLSTEQAEQDEVERHPTDRGELRTSELEHLSH
ncbi:macrolide resistance MFS transporter Mrx(A) [Kribbella koreensis]|uniref:Multidrug efflux pump Tap n=1 Tax=Kribbella koreensis TaxID=57909 RepID=A0ABN1RGP6_9ACTN